MLSKVEQETIICFNNATKEANVFTYSSKLKKKILEYAELFPDMVQIQYTTDEGGVSAIVPKRTVGIRSPKKREVTDEQRERMSRIAKELNAAMNEEEEDEEE